MTSRSSYDPQPTIPLPEGSTIWNGGAAWRQLDESARRAAQGAPVIAIDSYPGVDVPALVAELREALPEYTVIDMEDAAKPAEQLEAMIARNLTDDRVFGVMSHFTLDEFYIAAELDALGAAMAASHRPTVLVGWGAALVPIPHSTLVLADLARWEIQRRQRAGATNWRTPNPGEDNLRKYKRGFFVEWRTADRHKRDLFDRVDFVLDTNSSVSEAGLITGDAFRGALRHAVTAPFRVVPFFDPGVWGGQWMKDRLDLDPSADNYAWCFDCVPEENSLLLAADGRVVEVPAMDLVLTQPRALLGAKTFARFGAEFPIRFDFLDTMEGGNLSLQVHPLTDYILDTFGMHYTQDESYYLLDAGDDAVVYLGLKEGVDRDEMLGALDAAADPETPFEAERFVNVLPARKHDHFSIPAGTVHASGANSMVLEISATPFIFTFKLWDWGRVGLDGIPRPVHLEHGARNIQWDRDTAWVQDNLLDQVEPVSDEGGVREERTGLHALEFLEVRRHWFEEEAAHDTEGTVNVLNLVEGDAVDVVSPSGAFAPFRVHYAETFIVPAAVGPYIVRRAAGSTSGTFATVKASVRGTVTTDN
ncbi:class I mannose-6-phosphate isomerase [Leifsonia shinshuensis]|uniref:Mannose-6-phosphate isomerase n=1 Tax=Leifsonia shinshuensis TaxID=150026 RepID=A0A7G6Y9Y3_9MICO|nr:class I mannose-6-phosphate isomerase [Leifsonia shinshuensis]QNE35298.1 mannose-6-phosphate isomerase [Leifsonia shinshuensis]